MVNGWMINGWFPDYVEALTYICKPWQKLLRTHDESVAVVQFEWTVQHYLQVDNGLFYYFWSFCTEIPNHTHAHTRTHKQTQPQRWDRYDLMPLGNFSLNWIACPALLQLWAPPQTWWCTHSGSMPAGYTRVSQPGGLEVAIKSKQCVLIVIALWAVLQVWAKLTPGTLN